jgi:hypothetical protein
MNAYPITGKPAAEPTQPAEPNQQLETKMNNSIPTQQTSPWLNKAQVAHRLGVSIFYVEQLFKQGRLKVSRPSYRIARVHVDDVDKLMADIASLR